MSPTPTTRRPAMFKVLAALLLACSLTSCLATQAAQEDLSEAIASLNARAADPATTDSELAEVLETVKTAMAAVPAAARADAVDLSSAFSTQGIGMTLTGLVGLWLARNGTRKREIPRIMAESSKPPVA